MAKNPYQIASENVAFSGLGMSLYFKIRTPFIRLFHSFTETYYSSTINIFAAIKNENILL